MTETRRLAAIDLGTVTSRLLIADVGADAITEVYRSTDITHLGEGLARSGRLADEAMRRVADVVADYVVRIGEYGAERTSAVATSASRDADNGEEFRALLAVRGTETMIIDGVEEAALAFSGATFSRVGEGLLVVDSGGGSTELVLGSVELRDGVRETRIDAARSIDVGSRRMTERYLHGDPPTTGELDVAREWATREMRAYFDRLDAKPREMIGLAGTVTSLAAIRLALDPYDAEAVHGYELSGSDLADLLEMLVALTLEERRSVTGLHPERAGVIVAGALILETVLALSGLGHMTVSEHDVLYGILGGTFADLRERGR